MLRSSCVTLTLLTLVACGGGGGSGTTSTTPPPVTGGGEVTGERAVVNSVRLGELKTFRSQCGGAALPDVVSDDRLITSAVKHGGWQALYDQKNHTASLNHYEPDQTLPLSVDDSPFIRMQDAGAPSAYNIPMAEDIASMSDGQTMLFLWNTVYHRIPMMMHAYTHLGYGDMRLARMEYPAANVPAVSPWDGSDNGYATLDWFGDSAPSITQSWWPGAGLSGVPTTFYSNTESPDPVPGLNAVGPPLHVIFPTTRYLTTLTARLRPTAGGADLTLRILVGTGLGSGAIVVPPGTIADSELDVGQVFLIPMSPLASGVSYTWSCSASDASGALPAVSNTTFTTAP